MNLTFTTLFKAFILCKLNINWRRSLCLYHAYLGKGFFLHPDLQINGFVSISFSLSYFPVRTTALGFKSFWKLISFCHYESVFLFSCTSYISLCTVVGNYITALTYQFTFITCSVIEEANEYLRSNATRSQISCLLYFLAHLLF